jgi:hypothetical protein
VQISRKIHFVLFNLIAADVYFIGARTALHAKIIKETRFRFLATIVILGMVFYDTIEIAWIACNVLYYSTNKNSSGNDQKLEEVVVVKIAEKMENDEKSENNAEKIENVEKKENF